MKSTGLIVAVLCILLSDNLVSAGGGGWGRILSNLNPKNAHSDSIKTASSSNAALKLQGGNNTLPALYQITLIKYLTPN